MWIKEGSKRELETPSIDMSWSALWFSRIQEEITGQTKKEKLGYKHHSPSMVMPIDQRVLHGQHVVSSISPSQLVFFETVHILGILDVSNFDFGNKSPIILLLWHPSIIFRTSIIYL